MAKKTTKTTNDNALTLPQGDVPPGERRQRKAITKPRAEKPAVDAVLVDQAVKNINAIHAAKGLETARAIGEYLLKAFFGGSLETFAATGKKNLSFRALAEREDLNVGHSSLWYSVAVLDQLRMLPKDIGDSLPLSHHRLLLPVKDTEAKVALAKKAVESGMSKAAFADVVRPVRASEIDVTKTGRPALPSWAKGVGNIRKAVEAALEDEITEGDIMAAGMTKLKDRRDEVERAIAQLQVLVGALDRALVAGHRIGAPK